MATDAAPNEPLKGVEHIRARAARIWRYRFVSELSAAERFRKLTEDLRAVGASRAVTAMANRAAADELRHADLCSSLIRHFGGTVPDEPRVCVHDLAPARFQRAERVLYEVVALSCVTETMSTALLGELVHRARDPLTRQTMHAILSDEVMHARLGWAFLAEGHARAARAAIAGHLPDMLRSALGQDAPRTDTGPNHVTDVLAGLGSLPWRDKERIVTRVLQSVVFPGLDRFGIDTKLGRRWLTDRHASPVQHLS